jgi:tetratricopeptide (TPR) repeat protein
LTLSPGFEQAEHLQSILHYSSGDLQRGYSVISSLVSRKPDSFDYNYTLAQVLLKMGRWEEALSRLRHCMRLSADSAKAVTMVGIAMHLNGDHQRAQWFLSRAIHLDPKDKRALLWMIGCKLQNAEEAAAIEYTFKFLEGMSVEQIDSWINRSLDEGFMPQDSKEYLSRWIWSQAGAQPLEILKSSPS